MIFDFRRKKTNNIHDEEPFQHKVKSRFFIAVLSLLAMPENESNIATMTMHQHFTGVAYGLQTPVRDKKDI